MTWADFCRLNANSIAPRYQRASKETLRIPADDKGRTYTRKLEYLCDNLQSVMLLGKAGRGKTHFMFAFLRELFDRKLVRLGDIRIFRMLDFDAKLVEAQEQYKSCKHFIRDMSELPILCLDDFGIERATEKAERDYYDLIDHRTSFDRVTILSSNLSEEQIKTYYGERIDSRLKSFAKIQFNGPDLREGQDI